MGDLAMTNVSALIIDGTRFTLQTVSATIQPPQATSPTVQTARMWVASGVPADGGLAITAPLYLGYQYHGRTWTSSIGGTTYRPAVYKAKTFSYIDGNGYSATITTLAPHPVADVTGSKLRIALDDYNFLIINGDIQRTQHLADWGWNPMTQTFTGNFDVQALGVDT